MARIASMSVYSKETGREVVRGETVWTIGSEQAYQLVCATSPTVPGKSGKIYVNRGGFDHEYYAHIFGVVVKGRMDCGCPVGPDAPGHLDTCKED